jgi:hypothetical protein
MSLSKIRVGLVTLVIVSLVFSSFPVSAAAAAGPTFTLTAASTYLYSGPSKSTSRVLSIFKDQSYPVVGRSSDSAWLKLGLSIEAWVQTNTGTLSVEVSTLPVVEGNTAPVSTTSTTTSTQTTSGGTPGVVLPPTKYTYTITAPSTYVRSGPARSNSAILSAFKGQVFVVRGRSADLNWIQVVLTGGPVDAWITAGAGKLSTDIANLPVAVPGAAPAQVAVTNPTQTTTKPVTVTTGTVSVTPGGFELGGQVAGFDSPDKMKYAGMVWVKRQVRWGPGATADAGLINDAHGKGFKVLLSVLGDPGSIAGGANYDDYARFVGDLARFGADAIEVWNEMNIDREWPSGSIGPSSYVPLLQKAYSAIKANNPGTLVISGAPAPTGYFGGCGTGGCDDKPYIEGLVAAGGLNYLDCIGIHYNEGIVPPTQVGGDPRGNSGHYTRYYQTMVDTYYNAAGGKKKLCFTELGYLSGEEWGYVPGGFLWKPPYNLTVAEQASYLGQAAQLSRDQGKVRLMIVFNVDLKNYDSDPQAGYAIIRPNGGCPACETLRAVTGGR